MNSVKQKLRTEETYQVVVANCVPKTEIELRNLESCCIEINLETWGTSQERTKLVSLIDWISKHFERCLILLDDYSHFYKVQIEQQISEKETRDSVRSLAREIQMRMLPLFAEKAKFCEFQFAMSSEIQKSAKYSIFAEKTLTEFKSVGPFSKIVQKYAGEMNSLRPRNQEERKNFDLTKLFSQLVLEKLTVMACVYDAGYSTWIRNGSIGLQKDLSKARFSSLPDEITRITTISVKFKRDISPIWKIGLGFRKFS